MTNLSGLRKLSAPPQSSSSHFGKKKWDSNNQPSAVNQMLTTRNRRGSFGEDQPDGFLPSESGTNDEDISSDGTDPIGSGESDVGELEEEEDEVEGVAGLIGSEGNKGKGI
jgi:hypothetical protein